MGTMLQRHDLTEADFSGFDGCNEILNLTRPEVVASIHRAYFEAGSDMVETNTFGANLTSLAEYGLVDRLPELAEAGARLARQVADQMSQPGRPRWVVGSVGPGTKLPSLGQVSYAELRDGYELQVAAMIRGGVDAIQIETHQDLLAARAAVAGARSAMSRADGKLPILVSVTVETTGTLLVGADLTAVVATLAGLGVDGLGINCATGPEGMKGYLRQLAQISPLPLTCMPNAGLPVLTSDGAVYPQSPQDFAQALASYATEDRLSVVGGCCGTTPEHIAALVAELDRNPAGRLRGGDATAAQSVGPGWVASAYTAVPLHQDVSYLSIGERTNAAGSKAFREAMMAGDWDLCAQIARRQVDEGAHVIDLCVDYVGRDGTLDMAELAGRFTREVDAPIQLDSSDPAVIRVGLERCAGRAIVNSVHFESGSGPDSKFAQMMAAVTEHGAAVVGLCIDESGQARTVEQKVSVATRLITTLTSQYGMAEADIIIDCLTFPIATGQASARHDAVDTIEAIAQLTSLFPDVHTVLGISNVSFGLKPAARVVLNSIFLDQCRVAGLDCAIVHPSKILPLASIPLAQVEAGLDLVLDRRDDALDRFLALFDTVQEQQKGEDQVQLDVTERIERHILDGAASGLEADMDEALGSHSALELINGVLLPAMRTVGERFGSGRTQLPFVLKSAEVMKKAVTWLEPYLDRTAETDRGTLVLATVRGDVHDIGKNLVDIIVSNNGYRVINLGIKQPIADIITAAEQVGADAIGLSGLLVKSTQVMKENLEELNDRGLATKYPVLLGGAALTRDFVESDLSAIYHGQVRYAADAFDGLALMDEVMAAKSQSDPTSVVPTPRVRTPRRTVSSTARSQVTRPVPDLIEPRTAPFWGRRQATASLPDVVDWLDERSLFAAQWSLRAVAGGTGFDDVVASQGRPRLARWLEYLTEDPIMDFAAVWGYWPCHSQGNDLVVCDPGWADTGDVREIVRFSFPRQDRGDRLCLADYFRDEAEADRYGQDVVGLQLVTAGSRVGQRTAELFATDHYRDYFELHGLSVQLTEALAELWHARMRDELGLPELTHDKATIVSKQAYVGERFSFGYPACPDLSQRVGVAALLDPSLIGVSLSDQWQLHPEQSTDALIVHHPQAHYFSVR